MFRVHIIGLGIGSAFIEFLPSVGLPAAVCAGAADRAHPLAYDLRLGLAEGEIRALHIGERNVCCLGLDHLAGARARRRRGQRWPATFIKDQG